MVGLDRKQFEFGRGSFVGQVMRNPEDFFGDDLRNHARILGWVAGCPVVEELTDPAGGRGPEAMRNRYGHLSFTSTFIWAEAEKLNPDLAQLLKQDVERLPEEPIGKYESESVPDEYKSKMMPMTTLVGFALPRLFITASTGKDVNGIKYDQTVSDLRAAISVSKTPGELLSRFADTLSARGDLEPTDLLKQLLPEGWYEEHKALSMVDSVKAQLAVNAPGLWSAYEALNKEAKKKLKLL